MAKVLIVEDDELTLRVLEFKLKTRDYEIDTMPDGRKLMEKLSSDKPDMLILDINLPFIDGITLIKSIRERGNPIPILVISSMELDTVVKKAMDEGANDYLPKPFIPNDLLAKVDVFLGEAE